MNSKKRKNYQVEMQWVPQPYEKDHPYYDPNFLGFWEVKPIQKKKRITKWTRQWINGKLFFNLRPK